MSAFKVKKLGYLAAVTTLLALVVAQGCGSDDNQAAPTGGAGKSSAGAGGKANTTAGAGGKASTTAGDTGKAGGDPIEEGGAGGAIEMGMGGEGGEGVVGPDCSDPTGCYSCTPKTNAQFLNHCVEGGCPAHFDNSTLTKLDLVGTL